MSGSLKKLTRRRNGEIIIQTLLSLENSTFINIVAKICDDNNVIYIFYFIFKLIKDEHRKNVD